MQVDARHIPYLSVAVGCLFFVFGVVWVELSDRLLELLIKQETVASAAQSTKDLVFIAIVSVGVGLVARKFQHKLNSSVDQSEANYQQLFDNSPAPLLVVDLDTFQIEKSNQYFKQLYEYSDKQAKCLVLEHLFDAETWQKVKQFVTGAKQNQTKELLDIRSLSANRNFIDVTLSVDFLSLPDRKLAILVFKDITRTRRYLRDIEQAMHRLDIAREVSGMGCWEIDLSDHKIYCCTNVVNILDAEIEPDKPISVESLEQQASTDIFSEIKSKIQGQSEEVRQEETIVDNQGNSHHVVVHAQYMKDESKESIVGTFIDLSRQKQTENRLRARERQLQSLLELLPEGVALFRDSKVEYCNQRAATIIGVDDPKTLIGKPIFDFVSSESRESIEERVRQLMQGNKQFSDFMPRKLVRKDGETVEVEIAAQRIPTGDSHAVQIVIRDLTETLQMQHSLTMTNKRLAALSSKALSMLEYERKRIAGELHDDIGQSLTAIKLATKWLERRLVDEKLLKKVRDLAEITGDTLETVRNLSLMLRPSQLDSLGLPEALEWQAKRLFPDEGIRFSVKYDGYKHQLGKEVETTAFRVAQECLTNVVRHANARSVEVSLETNEHQLLLTIVDDGLGFDVKKQSQSTGLINMKERVELAGGVIEFRSLPRVGTEVRVKLPLDIENREHGNISRQLLSGDGYVE